MGFELASRQAICVWNNQHHVLTEGSMMMISSSPPALLLHTVTSCRQARHRHSHTKRMQTACAAVLSNHYLVFPRGVSCFGTTLALLRRKRHTTPGFIPVQRLALSLCPKIELLPSYYTFENMEIVNQMCLFRSAAVSSCC